MSNKHVIAIRWTTNDQRNPLEFAAIDGSIVRVHKAAAAFP